MRTPLQLLSFALLLIAAGLPLAAQQTPQPEPQPPAPRLFRRPPPTEVLKTGTQLVLVDVVVQDRAGQPVHGLQRSDFTLTEDKTPQTIRNFDEHSHTLTSAAAFPPGPKLPPGTFTDYMPVAPDGTLNILLLDALNTPMKDQSYVRYQLQQYVKHADPGTRIAIFGLNTHLILLQGFTAQPEVLKDAVEHKLTPRASNLLDDPATGSSDESLSSELSGMGASAMAGLSQFEAQIQSFQTQMRLQYTLDAFNQLARYLSNYPGRKNLIWFSGSFPIDILPDDTLADPFSVVASGEQEFRETANLLVQSRVSVYPIDARGLMTEPVYDASQSGHGFGRNPNAFAGKISGFAKSQANEHMTMDELAQETGGHAFYDTNGLAQAVDKAINAGSNYYTLAYTPTNHKADGAYRSINVSLNGAAAARGVQLAYRRGYYADQSGSQGQASAITLASDPGADARLAANYAQAALDRGAPQPSDILFKVRVLPASTATETSLAPGNQTDPQKPLKGPFRRYDVDFAALPASFTFTPQPDGKRFGSIEFTVLVYDSQGKLLNADGRTAQIDLPPAEFADFARQPLAMHLEVSAPVKPESFFRIAIEDGSTNRFGVVEVPTSSVDHLPPPVYPNGAPPAVQAAPAPAPPAAPAH